METKRPGKSRASAAGNSRQRFAAIGDARQNLRVACFGGRARDSVGLRGRGHAPAMSPELANSPRRESGTSTVTFVTPEAGVWSQTVGACRWTIEMTQFVFRRVCGGTAPGWHAKSEKGTAKTVSQRMGNALIREEIEKSENGR